MFSGENLWPDYETDFGAPPAVPSFAGTTEIHALPSQEGSFILSLDEAANNTTGTIHNSNNNNNSTTPQIGSNPEYR